MNLTMRWGQIHKLSSNVGTDSVTKLILTQKWVEGKRQYVHKSNHSKGQPYRQTMTPQTMICSMVLISVQEKRGEGNNIDIY